MKKSKFLLSAAFVLAIGAAFAFKPVAKKTITYYPLQNCAGTAFTPSETCTLSSGTFCYSESDGTNCTNRFKN